MKHEASHVLVPDRNLLKASIVSFRATLCCVFLIEVYCFRILGLLWCKTIHAQEDNCLVFLITLKVGKFCSCEEYRCIPKSLSQKTLKMELFAAKNLGGLSWVWNSQGRWQTRERVEAEMPFALNVQQSTKHRCEVWEKVSVTPRLFTCPISDSEWPGVGKWLSSWSLKPVSTFVVF